MTYTAPQDHSLRVSDADREAIVELLQTAYGEGRLEAGEFELRLQLALTSRTVGELAALTADLDGQRPVDHRRAGSVAGASVVGPLTSEERLMAALAQGTTWVPVVVFPAIILATTGKRSAYVRHHAAEALNLQLTLLAVTLVTFGLGGIVYGVAWAIATVAAVLAVAGQDFRFPFVLRLFGRRPGDPLISGRSTR